MARYTGKSTLSATYNVKDYRPLDTRMLVPAYSDLTLSTNWSIDGYGSIAYNGMIVAVGSNTADTSKNGIYYLFDASNPKAGDEPDVTVEANWHKVAELNEIDSIKERILSLETNYATVSAVDKAISDLRAEINEAGYLTDADLTSAISETKAYVDSELEDYVTAATFTETVSELVTDDELTEAINAIPKTDLTGYAKIDDIPVVPTKLSEFENDTNYLTSIPLEYVTELELDSKGYLTAHQDLSDYAKKSEVPSVEGLASTEYVDEIAAAKANTATTLSGYGISDAYTKTQVDDLLTELSTGGNINLDGYVSEDEWNERIQDYVTTSDVENINNNISSLEEVMSAKCDKSYVTEQLNSTNTKVASIEAAITYGTF